MASQDNIFPNPHPLSMAVLASACFAFGALYLGKVTVDAFPILACWLIPTGLIPLMIGVMALKNYKLEQGNFFLFCASFFILSMALAMLVKYYLIKRNLPFDSRIEGYALMAAAAFLTVITPSYLKTSRLLLLLIIMMDLSLWGIVGININMLALAIFKPVVGWLLMVAGFLAIYLAGAVTLNQAFEKEVMPVPGPIRKA